MSRKYNVDEINLQIYDVQFWGEWERNLGGMQIYWDSDIGFGSLTIVKHLRSDDAEMFLSVDTECMDSEDDKAFTRKILSLLTDVMAVEG